MVLTPETWIISDTHFGHSNIVKYCGRPIEHNQIMLRNWRNEIAPGDQVLHLGDLAVWYGETEKMWSRTAAALPGNKFMLRGNHDNLTDEAYGKLGYKIVPEFVQEFNGQRVLFSHHPDDQRLSEWDINIHGHIHNNPLDERYAKLFPNHRYQNVSIEVMGYHPHQLRDLINV